MTPAQVRAAARLARFVREHASALGEGLDLAVTLIDITLASPDPGDDQVALLNQRAALVAARTALANLSQP